MGQGASKTTDIKSDNQVVCLRIPADGTSPHLVCLPTVSNYDGNHDSYLVHLPDFRLYWCSEERWKFRTFGVMDIRKQDIPELNGLYYMYKSFAMDNTPINKHLETTRGDAFVIKLESEYGSAGRAVYSDIPPELPESRLLDFMVDAMSTRGTDFWLINYDDGEFEYAESVYKHKEVVQKPYPRRRSEKKSGRKHNPPIIKGATYTTPRRSELTLVLTVEPVTRLHPPTMYRSKVMRKSPRLM
ncbi:hypothetical protein BDQ17DRAFT_1372763 [Cyathus striatus]|nr:hypothetical protein BDQ17DRAFT_1372763 [Cyathus striatus]